jgi:hypothetical protein
MGAGSPNCFPVVADRGRAPVGYTVGFFGFFGFGGRFGVLSPMCHLLCGV